MRDRRCVEDLSIEELEQVLLIRRREERLARMRRVGLAGPASSTVIVQEPGGPTAMQSWETSPLPDEAGESQSESGPFRVWRERILLAIEGAALIGLLVVIANLALSVRNLNQEWREQRSSYALPTPTPTALIRVSILPGGHRPPPEAGGTGQPIGPEPILELPTPGPRAPTRLVIPSLNVDTNVVEGDTWEQLKKGAGHHIGSANPGERGNCFISGHNDVYGEIFRYLEKVQPDDEIIVYAGDQPFRYIVTAPPRVVEPDDVSVMYPTSKATLTLLTCHPYMVDTHRMIVIATLEK